jgi:hypothetical protein
MASDRPPASDLIRSETGKTGALPIMLAVGIPTSVFFCPLVTSHWQNRRRVQHAANRQWKEDSKSMPRDPKTAKKTYSSPTLVALGLSAARAKLEAQRDPKDGVTKKMLSLIDEQLNKAGSGLHISHGAN